MTYPKLVQRRLARIASLVFAGLAIFGGEKVAEYSSPPSGTKNCDFIFPEPSESDKPTNLRIVPPSRPFSIDSLGGQINDASCLNKTPIYGIVRVHTVQDLRDSLEFARANHLHVSIAGQRHSMGGQSFSKNGLILDMRGFNQISIDRERAIAHVQTGATWAQVQQLADHEGLSVQAMQSINVFSIGGSLSVNGHGIDPARWPPPF